MSSTIEVHLTREEARAGVTRTFTTDTQELTVTIPPRVKDDTTVRLTEDLFLRVRVEKSRAKKPLLIGAGVLTALMVFATVNSVIKNSPPGSGPSPTTESTPATAAAAPATAAIGQCVLDGGVLVDLAPVPCLPGTLEVLDVTGKSTADSPCELSAATTHTARTSRPPFLTFCLKKIPAS